MVDTIKIHHLSHHTQWKCFQKSNQDVQNDGHVLDGLKEPVSGSLINMRIQPKRLVTLHTERVNLRMNFGWKLFQVQIFPLKMV